MKGTRITWIVVAVIITALVLGLVIQRTFLTNPDPFQTKVNNFETQGYPVQAATYLASTNLTVLSTNSTYAEILLLFPSNETADVTIKVSPNQTYTPTQAEVSNVTNGIYNVNFTQDNTSLGEELRLQYFVANAVLSNTTAVPASVIPGLIALSIGYGVDSQMATPSPGYTMMNGGGGRIFGGVVEINIHHLHQLKGILESVKALEEAALTSQEYLKWVSQLNELQDCAENPTNPVTINGYVQNPGQEQQIVSTIADAKSELKSLTIARFVNIAVSLSTELVGKLGLDVAALIAGGYSAATLTQLSEELVKSIESLVTPCTKTTTTSTGTTNVASITRTVSLSSFTGSETVNPTFYGNFEWTLGTGANTFVESASGSFTVIIDSNTHSITGIGTGYVSDTLTGMCVASTSGSYAFNVTGQFYANNLSLLFGDASPPSLTTTETCPGIPNYVPTTQTYFTGSGIQPHVVIIPAVDGATVSCPPSCFGGQLTYKISISTTQPTSTTSFSTTLSETPITSSQTSTSTASSSSSVTTSYTYRVSNSTSTSTG